MPKDETLLSNLLPAQFSLCLAVEIIRRGKLFSAQRLIEVFQCGAYCSREPFLNFLRFAVPSNVQSRIESDCYFQVKTALKAGRWVYFSGMQCQLAALKVILARNIEKLITPDYRLPQCSVTYGMERLCGNIGETV